jgi:SAM-dependent methyltransferase
VALNGYEDTQSISRSAGEGHHREIIGGLWDEIGKLQFEFLVTNGLTPSSTLMDVGCGSLRGGVHFVSYLNDNLYFGLDSNDSLLDAGYNIELKSLGIQEKLQRKNLLCNDSFDFDAVSTSFDFALAQSLFTHLPLNHIRLCLSRLAPKMKPGGKFYATFFLVGEDHPFGQPCGHIGAITSFDAKDPYHYRFSDITRLCEGLQWRVRLHGDWGHPRDQRMVEFVRTNERPEIAEQGPDDSVRLESFESAVGLPPGANHYRAYVGPPDRFDFMSATQFSLLFALGLRDHHRVLDFGCGSLRLGRLLIPFLRAARYYGIDPNRWLIFDAIDRELGQSILQIKQPRFAYNADFKCDVFDDGKKFDFVVAQSIITHCGNDLAEKLIREASGVLDRSGKFIFSIIEDTTRSASPRENGWVYPHCVAFGAARIDAMCTGAGLECRRLPWFHPAATWYIAAHQKSALPSDLETPLLQGTVLFAPQFERSRPARASDSRSANRPEP